MSWMALALAAALFGAWYAFTRDLHPLGVVLVAVAFGLVFVIGRRIEGKRDAAWEEAAAQLHARFDAAPAPEVLRRFGSAAPWDAWAQGGVLQCARAIDGSGAKPPFALLQVRYPLHETRGEASDERWQEVAVAVVRRPTSSGGAGLQRVDAAPGYEAAANGEWLFVWKEAAPAANAGVSSAQLQQLLQQAMRVLQGAPTRPS